MNQLDNQNIVDQIIQQFWKNGFLTVSRKYGTFLPEPKPLGKYEVDAVGRYKKKYAIGITLTEEELSDPKIYAKLNYLASRHNRNSQRKVILFVGVPKHLLKKGREIVKLLDDSIKRNIKIFGIEETDKSNYN